GAGGDDPAVTTQPAAPVTAPSARAEPVELALGYRATWAPPGFSERIRQLSAGEPDDGFGPSLMRVWTKSLKQGDPWGGPELSLYVRTEVPDPAKAMDTSGQKVDVNGAVGFYTGAPDAPKSYVTWAPGEHTALILAAGNLDISRSDLLRMARSVRADTGVTASPVRLNWLPPGWITSGATVSGQSPDRWRTDVYAVRRALDPSSKLDKERAVREQGDLSVVVDDVTDAPAGGETFTVGGRPARHPVRADEAGKSLIYLVVDLGGGRLMTLAGHGAGLTLDDLRRVAEQVEITPSGLGWLGR
ncbi:hypothetical protein AB0F81_48240, partial [Actinoplanes sp. NPDC024001]|uniref:hypothetical protein n=1 Tax=Actinoplanes sp. NPDC024001 TaxID=3154598 RepID=UPI0033ED365B